MVNNYSNNQIFFEDYLDTVESLPQEITRNFSKMKQLDGDNQGVVESIASQTKHFLAVCKDIDVSERRALLKEMTKAFRSSLEYGHEKVALATNTYDTVDLHVRRLDEDLEKFERELSSVSHDSRRKTVVARTDPILITRTKTKASQTEQRRFNGSNEQFRIAVGKPAAWNAIKEKQQQECKYKAFACNFSSK